eukprot:TRINITY_DN3484_c0_g1_i1.p1 TRINITY_DN3484_c0_g1~~TRINITY_DN3484_c0_g1_i1.p1  ORF type:complete len:702 (-),score=104.67 TRINITY_DN3484_c0_g1_i1:1576-3681(-)
MFAKERSSPTRHLDQKMMAAIVERDLISCRKLLQPGLRVTDGMLLTAAECGATDVFKFLLDSGLYTLSQKLVTTVCAKKVFSHTWPALMRVMRRHSAKWVHVAAQLAQWDFVSEFLSQGAVLSEVVTSLIHQAAAAGKLSSAQIVALTNAGVSSNTDCLLGAILNDDRALCELFLNRGVKPDDRCLIASGSKEQAFRALLDAGIISSVTLAAAIANSPPKLAILETLLRRGCSVNLPARSGAGPLQPPMQLALDLLEENPSDETRLKVVHTLLSFGASPNIASGPDRTTSLHNAIRNNNTAFVEQLMTFGCSLSMRNIDGDCAIDLVPAGATELQNLVAKRTRQIDFPHSPTHLHNIPISNAISVDWCNKGEDVIVHLDSGVVLVYHLRSQTTSTLRHRAVQAVGAHHRPIIVLKSAYQKANVITYKPEEKLLVSFGIPDSDSTWIVFSQDDSSLIVVDDSNRLSVISCATWNVSIQFLVGEELKLDIQATDQYVLCSTTEGVSIYDIPTGRRLVTVATGEMALRLSVLNARSFVCVTFNALTQESNIRVYAMSGEERFTRRTHAEESASASLLECVALAATEQHIYLVTRRRGVYIFTSDLRTRVRKVAAITDCTHGSISTHTGQLVMVTRDGIDVLDVASTFLAWTPAIHRLYSQAFRDAVRTLLLMNTQAAAKHKPAWSKWTHLPQAALYNIIHYLSK